MTLRIALLAADFDKVFKLINKKDSRNAAACDRPPMEETVNSYTEVVKELLGKPRTRAYKMSWLVMESVDPLDKKKYADVCFLNSKYVAPAKGLKPWGGKNPPKGHYNCNDDKHSRTFATGWTPWSKIIDTPIINEAKFHLDKVVAEILWEMTFYGWTEEKVNDRVEVISGKLKEALKEVKQGKCITLPPKKKGGLKVVIPDCVSQQIIDITNKYAKKCGTCLGYGLWAIGDASPVGRMDASDGVPTKPCPECGADGKR